MFDWLFGKKEEELSQEVIAKLNRLPPQILQQAQAMVQSGNHDLWDKLVEIAKKEEMPEKPGFFGKMGKALWRSVKSSALTSVVVGGASAAVNYGLASFDSTAHLVGAKLSAEDRELVIARVRTENPELTGDAFDRMVNERVKAAEVEPWKIARDRGLTIGGMAMAIGTAVRTMTNWSAIDVEAQQEQMIWRMMNEPAAAPALAGRGAMAMQDPNIQVPRGLPMGGPGMQGRANV